MLGNNSDRAVRRAAVCASLSPRFFPRSDESLTILRLYRALEPWFDKTCVSATAVTFDSYGRFAFPIRVFALMSGATAINQEMWLDT